MKWIDVNEQLPDKGVRVLLYCKRQLSDDPSVVIGTYSGTRGYPYQCWEFHEDEDVTVTHWMPVPTANHL